MASSQSRCGFGPVWFAHQAIGEARGYLRSGYGFVVDSDLDALLDHADHDPPAPRLAGRVADKRLRKRVRGYPLGRILERTGR